MSAPGFTPGADELLAVTQDGHWSTEAGRDMAKSALADERMAQSRERISDFALANEVFLSPGIANLAVAKERIRWLSASLAIANARLAMLAASPSSPAGGGEVERLREALTPSAETKAAYHGEFQFNIEYADEDGNSYWQPHLVPWDQVKEIMAAILKRAALPATSTGRTGE